MSGNDCLAPRRDIDQWMSSTPVPANTIDLKALTRHDFDPFKYEVKQLVAAAAQVLTAEFAGPLKLDAAVVAKFVHRALGTMRDVPFHNAYHAFGVFQTLWTYLNSDDKYVKQLTPLERFSAVVAALCHDLDHPGLTNTHLINAKNPLAAKYNNLSVLENHHHSQLLEVLGLPGCDILASFSGADREAFHRIAKEAIGATDLAKQKDTIGVLEGMLANGIDMAKEKDRMYVIIGFVKCSDISNETKAAPLNNSWASRVNNEFFMQGDREKEKNMEMLPMMDRSLAQADPAKALAKGQLGFIQFVCAPLFDVMEKLFPATMAEPCTNMRNNTAAYKAIAA